MAKRPRKPTKTMGRGLHPFPSSLPDGFSPKEITQARETMAKILANNQGLSGKDQWILKQASLAASFRQATLTENLPKKNRILGKIRQHRDEGHELGFSEGNIGALNRAVLQIEAEGQLEEFTQELLRRRGE